MSTFFTGLASTFVTAVIAIACLIGAMGVFIIVLALIDQWQMRRAWRQADEWAHDYMRRHHKCPHSFPREKICPTCLHFNKIRKFERTNREGEAA